MKQLLLTAFLLFFAITSLNAQDKEVLGEIGYTSEGKTARAVMHSNVETDGTYTYLDFDNGYGFSLKNEQCETLANIVEQYRLEYAEEMVVLGTIESHAVTGVSTTENVTSPGEFETTYQKGAEIEIRYDGEDLWIHLPETKFLRYSAPAADIRIFKDYIDALIEAYTP